MKDQNLFYMLKLCEKVIITITMDGKELDGKDIWDKENKEAESEEQLFSFANKTVRRLIKLADEYQTEVLPIENLTANWRFCEKPKLAHLEQHLFRYPVVSFTDKAIEADKQQSKNGEKIASENNIRISAHKDVQSEVRCLCREIRRLLNESGCAYRDIAVIAGDLSAYESELEEEFMRYEIPFFMDKTRNILLNPFIEYIKSALSILNENFSYESVFHYLRSGLCDFTQDEIDDLENYVLEMGIRGRYAWTHMFVGRTLAMKKLDAKAESEEKENNKQQAEADENIITTSMLLENLNGLRKRLLEQLAPLVMTDSVNESEIKEWQMRMQNMMRNTRLI